MNTRYDVSYSKPGWSTPRTSRFTTQKLAERFAMSIRGLVFLSIQAVQVAPASSKAKENTKKTQDDDIAAFMRGLEVLAAEKSGIRAKISATPAQLRVLKSALNKKAA